MSAVPNHADHVDRMASLYADPRVDSLRVPPQSVEAEQSVLGALMLVPESLPRVADWLAAEDFYRRDHRLIYGAIIDLAGKGKPVDPVTLAEWFEANGVAEQAGGAGYLVSLWSNTPSAANIVAYAEIVSECARKRQVIELGTELVSLGFDRRSTSADIAAQAQTGLAQLAPVRHTGLQASKPGLKRWYAEMQARCDRPGLIGIATPWHELNGYTHGLRRGRLYIVAGRPGMGKSIIGCNLSSFAALRGTRTALFSLEMGAEEVHQRNVSALSGVPHDFLEAPGEESPHWSTLTHPVADLMAAPLLVDDSPGLTAPQICARAERAHLQDGLGLIVVDHLHEMAVDPKDRVNSLGDAARKLKGLAKRLDVPVVLLAQLNRAATTRGDNKRPTLSDLRASGSIEEVADAVFMLHREDYYNADTHLKGVVELAIVKGRNMRSGVTVHLRSEQDCMRFSDWEGPLPEAPPPPQESEQKPQRRGFDPRAKAAGSDR